MTTSNFPANTFSIYAGKRKNPALEAIAERRRRVHQWSRPLAAAIVATAFSFTALAAFRDGGRAIEASWRDASRPDVVVRHSGSWSNESSNARAPEPAAPSAAPSSSNAPMVASLTGSVPGLIGRSRAATAASADPEASTETRATTPAPPKPAAKQSPAPPAPVAKPVSRARAKTELTALDKLGSDITAKLK